jgi:tetratricopeptide (TPR) repeat protein
MLGKVIGSRYQIIQHLGGGGFGQTFLAEDLHLPGKPQCVVKQFKPKTSEPEVLETARRLFDAEASVLYMVGDHEQIPRLFAHFEENQEFYLVQELIEGEVLTQELLGGKTLPESEVVQLLYSLLTVLEFVHDKQVVHRDIKPSNLIRRRGDRRIVLIDFGAVKQVGLSGLPTENESNLTVTVGSFGYMPSEQLAGKPRLASDIYAVGMLAIQCLTGTNPKNLPDDPYTGEILWRDRAIASPELAEILEKMVRYDFRQRYPSAKEALEVLRPLADIAPVTALLSEPVAAPSSLSAAHYPTWVERGDELFQLQRFREAVNAYDKAIQAKSDEYLAWFKRGIALEHLQCPEDAAASYDQVVQLQPGDYLGWFKRGNAFESIGRYTEALESYDQVVQLQPDNYWAWHDLGKAHEALQQWESAVEAYDRAVKIKPDFQIAVEHRKRVLIQLKKVDTLYHLQHYDDALLACDRAIAENTNDHLAWMMRGMALEHQQRHEEALSAYQRVVEIQPDDHVAWFKQGGIWEALGHDEAALSAYHRVVQVQPENYWAWHDRGKILERLGRYDEAIACYDRAVQIKPDFTSAITSRTRMLTNPSRTNLALGVEADQTIPPNQQSVPASNGHSAAKAAAANKPPTHSASRLHPATQPSSQPNSEAARRTTAALESKDETYLVAPEQTHFIAPAPAKSPHTRPEKPEDTQVVTTLRHGIDPLDNPIEDWKLWAQQGQSLEKLKRRAEALAAYSKATQLHPSDAGLWRRRANLLFLMERYQEAIACYDHAIQLQPNNAELWQYLSNCLVHLKRYRDALTSFERVIKLQPRSHTPWYWRGRILCKLKHYSDALSSYETALSLKPDFQPARDEYQRLAKQLGN